MLTTRPTPEQPLNLPPEQPSPATIARWHGLQQRLAARVAIPPGDAELPERPCVLALDVQYVGGVGHVGASWSRSGENSRSYAARVPVDADYVPGSFCFREGPPLLATLSKLLEGGERIDLVLVDGHGTAHPRRFGVACYVGVGSGLPTIGCAKQGLLPWSGELEEQRGASSPVLLDNEVLGSVLRTRAQVKPVFVSPGHLVGLEQARRLVLDLPGTYRVPDPLREADRVCRQSAGGKVKRGWRDLGELEPAELC